MLMYIPTGAKLEVMNQISDQFDIFSKDPLLKEFTEKSQKVIQQGSVGIIETISRCKSYAQR